MLILIGRGAKFRVSGEHSHAVARDIDFRHHRHIALSGIIDDFFHLFLGVEGVKRALRVFARKEPFDFAGAKAAFSREFGVAFQFQAPSLVVGEVPVKDIQLVECHPIDKLFDIFHREKVAHHIEVHTTEMESGMVFNGAEGQARHIAGSRGQQLNERTHAIEKALRCLVVCHDVNAIAVDGHGVGTFGDGFIVIVTLNKDRGVALAFHNGQMQIEICFAIVLQIFGSDACIGISGINAHPLLQLQVSGRVGGKDGVGLRNNGNFCIGSRSHQSQKG